jgi:KipI family sensor histidine kinase inhibitor
LVDAIRLAPLGDRAYIVHFDSEHAAGSWAAAIRAQRLRGVTDVVLAYRAVAVFADPDVVDLAELESLLSSIAPAGESRGRGKAVVVPVYYDGADLNDVAARLNLSPSDLIDLHSRAEYDVFAIGFLPGFPYAGYLPPALAGLPRRDAPRARVPAGSVAIAGRQTGIYPSESPGGWHLLGTTPLCIAAPEEAYFPIRAGDRIRFEPISVSEFEARRNERLS